MLIIAFLSTVFFNLHNNPERQTLLSLFGRWGDRFRETEYSPKTMWLTSVMEPLFEHRPVWLLGRAQKLSAWSFPPNHAASTGFKNTIQEQWSTWCILGPKDLWSHKLILYRYIILLLTTFISGEMYFISPWNEFIFTVNSQIKSSLWSYSISITVTLIHTLVALPWTTKLAAKCTLYLQLLHSPRWKREDCPELYAKIYLPKTWVLIILFFNH